MKVLEYKYALRRLGLTQQMAGQVFGMSKRTGQRWARYGPPESVAAVLLMVDGDRHKLDVLLNQSKKQSAIGRFISR